MLGEVITPEVVQWAVTAIWMAVLSIGFEVIPGLKDGWNKVPTKWKPLVFLVICLVVAYVLPVLACYGIVFKSTVICATIDVPAYILDAAFAGFSGWYAVLIAFKFVQDPISKSLKAKLAMQEYRDSVKNDAVG